MSKREGVYIFIVCNTINKTKTKYLHGTLSEKMYTFILFYAYIYHLVGKDNIAREH